LIAIDDQETPSGALHQAKGSARWIAQADMSNVISSEATKIVQTPQLFSLNETTH